MTVKLLLSLILAHSHDVLDHSKALFQLDITFKSKRILLVLEIAVKRSDEHFHNIRRDTFKAIERLLLVKEALFALHEYH